MKCEKCDQEFSDSVYPFHILRCPDRVQSEQTEIFQGKGETESEHVIVETENIQDETVTNQKESKSESKNEESISEVLENTAAEVSEEVQPEQTETVTGKKKKGK